MQEQPEQLRVQVGKRELIAKLAKQHSCSENSLSIARAESENGLPRGDRKLGGRIDLLLDNRHQFRIIFYTVTKLIFITAPSSTLQYLGTWCGVLHMVAAIHVVPDDNFDDWVVRDDKGCERGHYPTRENAEFAAQAVARELGTRLVIHLPDGRTSCINFSRGWLARLFGSVGLRKW